MSIKVVAFRDILSNVTSRAELSHGMNFKSIIKLLDLQGDQLVYCDGVEIAPEHFDDVPDDGARILIRSVPTALAGTIIAWAITAAVVSTIAIAIIDAFIPDKEKKETVPSVRGASNTSNEWNPVPIILGRHYIVPYYAGLPYTSVSGTDGVNQHINLSFLIGYGPLEITDIRIGENLLASNKALVHSGAVSVATGLFSDYALIDLQENNTTDMAYYPDHIVEDQFTMELARPSGIVYLYRNTPASCIGFELDIEFPNGLVRGSGGDASINLKAEYKLSTASSWTTVPSSDTTITKAKNVTLRYTFASGVLTSGQYNIRYWKVDTDTADTTIQDTVNWVALRSKISGKVVATAIPDPLSAAEQTVRMSMKLTASAGIPSSVGKISCVAQQLIPLYARSGTGYTAWATPAQVTLAVSVTITSATYKFSRASGSFITDGFVVGDNISVGGFIDAYNNGYFRVATVSALDLTVEVVTLVNETLATGALFRRVSSNPAAQVLYLLRSVSIPAVANANIDFPAFESLYEWCVTNAVECNGVISEQVTLRDAIAKILSTCRAQLSMTGDMFTILQDAPKATAYALITPRNSSEFKGSKAFADVPHGYRVQYINALAGYQADEVLVLDDGYVYPFAVGGTIANRKADGDPQEPTGGYVMATKLETISLPYVTDGDQAFKEGRFQLAKRRLRPETFSVKQDFRHIGYQRFDRVQFAHDVPLIGVQGGMIKSVTMSGSNVSVITLDEEITMEVGKTYGVRWQRAIDGVLVLAALTLVVGTSVNCTLAVPAGASTAPAAGDQCWIGETGEETLDAIVTDIEPGDDLSATIQLQPYNEAIYTGGTIPAYDPHITLPQAVSPADTFEAWVEQSKETNAVIAQAQAQALALNALTASAYVIAASAYDKSYVGANYFVCDGTDDDVQIQAAIDWVVATYGGGTVQLTAGEFYCVNPIYPKTNTRWCGVGDATVVHIAQDYGVIVSNEDGVVIQGMLLSGAGASAWGYLYGIYLYDYEDGAANKIIDVHIAGLVPHPNGATAAIGSDGSYGNTQIINCVIDAITAVSGNTSVYGVRGGRNLMQNTIGVMTKYGTGVAYGVYAAKKCLHNHVKGASTAKYYQSYADNAGTAGLECADTAAGGYNS